MSIEEYLGSGSNTGDYYDALAEVGGGNWQPERDARPWIRFVLWARVEREVARHKLPERAVGPVFNASLGFRMRNATYRDLAHVSDTVAGRDLKALVGAGLLVAVGERRGRHYRAAPPLLEINAVVRTTRRRIEDPFERAPIPQTLGR